MYPVVYKVSKIGSTLMDYTIKMLLQYSLLIKAEYSKIIKHLKGAILHNEYLNAGLLLAKSIFRLWYCYFY